MADYELRFTKSVAKELLKIPKTDLKRVLKRIERLCTDPRPHGCEKLSDQERYRVRQGDYRIVYEIEDRVLLVVIVRVGHRREVYGRS